MLRRGLVLVVIVFACLVASGTSGAGPLRTGFIDPQIFNEGANEPYAAAANAGATTVRLYFNWRDRIAPPGSTKPSPFNAADSFDPEYNEAGWRNFDARVKAAKANGLEPIVFISNAPDWAQGAGNGPAGSRRPSPAEFGAVARAAAIRYSGETPDPQGSENLPRVRYWQAWNEPNRNYFLSPQGTPAKPIAPAWYRALLAHFALNVRGVQDELDLEGRNIVIAGGLAPFGRRGHLAPFTFMEKLLCMSATRPARKVCNASKASFDIWSHHPYTCGGPTQQAVARKDASLGDMAEMRAVLRAAAARGRINSTQKVGLWVTEISWDTRPADPKGVPNALHARWVSEMLYRLWRLNVGSVTWFQLEDLPRATSDYQSGLHPVNGIANNRKKLSHTAFRFPFVAFVAGRKVRVWGRTPPEAPAQTVIIERRTPSTGWRRVATTRSQSTGIFGRLITMTRVGSLRARITQPGAAASVPFTLRRPNNPRICPFGS